MNTSRVEYRVRKMIFYPLTKRTLSNTNKSSFSNSRSDQVTNQKIRGKIIAIISVACAHSFQMPATMCETLVFIPSIDQIYHLPSRTLRTSDVDCWLFDPTHLTFSNINSVIKVAHTLIVLCRNDIRHTEFHLSTSTHLPPHPLPVNIQRTI